MIERPYEFPIQSAIERGMNHHCEIHGVVGSSVYSQACYLCFMQSPKAYREAWEAWKASRACECQRCHDQDAHALKEIARLERE